MAKDAQSDEIELGTLVDSTGRSLTEVQKAMVADVGLPVNMMLSNAELELKVAVNTDKQGKTEVKTISSQDLSKGNIDPGLLSTLRLNFVGTVSEKAKTAVPATEPSAAAPAATTPVTGPSVAAPITTTQVVRPSKTSQAITKLVQKRADIKKLEKSKGKLVIKPVFVPEAKRWLVAVEDTKGKAVREIILPD